MNTELESIDWTQPESVRPIFIVGCQRSGTTLLRTILHSHPSLSIGYECAYYRLLSIKYGQCASVVDNLDEFLDDLYKVRRFCFWDLEKEFLRDKFKECTHPVSYSQAVLFIAELYRQQHKPTSSIIGFKNPNGILHIPYIFSLFPQARIIHIIRDPRAVFASEKKKAIALGRYEPARLFWQVMRRHQAAMRVSQSYMNHEQVYNLSYESLVSEFKDSVAKLIDWIGVPESAEVYDYYKENKGQTLTPSSEMWQHSLTRQVPQNSRIEAFRTELNTAELKAVELFSIKSINNFEKKFLMNFSHLKGVPFIVRATSRHIGDKLAVLLRIRQTM